MSICRAVNNAIHAFDDFMLYKNLLEWSWKKTVYSLFFYSMHCFLYVEIDNQKLVIFQVLLCFYLLTCPQILSTFPVQTLLLKILRALRVFLCSSTENQFCRLFYSSTKKKKKIFYPPYRKIFSVESWKIQLSFPCFLTKSRSSYSMKKAFQQSSPFPWNIGRVYVFY